MKTRRKGVLTEFIVSAFNPEQALGIAYITSQEDEGVFGQVDNTDSESFGIAEVDEDMLVE